MKTLIAVCLIIIPLAFASIGLAQVPPALSWKQFVAHSGLAGLAEKTEVQFKVDLVPDMGRRIKFIRAEIQLSEAEWSYINANEGFHLLSPWMTGKIDNETWKSTIDFILPFDGCVNVDRIKIEDKVAILHRPDTQSTRVYVLSPNSNSDGGVLFYFFRNP